MQIDPKDISFIQTVIHSNVASHVRNGTIPRGDRDQVAADLMQEMVACWHQYDAARGPREAFVNQVISTKLISTLRMRNAKKRTSRVVSLDAVADSVDAPQAQKEDSQRATERRLDLELLMQHVTPFERDLLHILKTSNIKQAAERLGIPRRTVRDHCEAIREVFRDAGLNGYL